MAILGALRAIMGGKSKSEGRADRPQRLAEYTGQEEVTDVLRIALDAASGLRRTLKHVLITGPAGLGKTTLALIVAAELGVAIKVVMGPAVKDQVELVQTLLRLTKNSILFIDEIHALSPKIAEILYTAMEDGFVMVGGEKVMLQPFTLIGATTNMGLLLKPLKDRFAIKLALRPYKVEKLAEIVQAAAAKRGVDCSPEAAAEIARRSQQTPRIALSILSMVEDCAYSKEQRRVLPVDHATAVRGCEAAGYDKSGLSALARLYLRTLADRGVPLALGTMVSVLGESKDVVEEEVEPYLLSIGFIEKTSKGRTITAAGRRHLMGAV
jgi:holliday junction DNA helicase RuvB